MRQSIGKYKGWNVRTLENKWIKLIVAPKLGGRIIQCEMGGYDFFFNNPLLYGKEPDETRLGKNMEWLNFGGEKIWPAPQGWDTLEQWPGPPDPILDSGIYSVSKKRTSENRESLTVTSPIDPRTGLQIRKEVFVEKNRSVTIVNTSFFNKTQSSIRWSVWPVIQMNTQLSEVIDNRYRIICPVNPASRFKDGFKVMHGLVNNPQNRKDASGNLIVNYMYLVGKIGLDTSAGWIAFLDLKTGKIFVLTFNYKENTLYPENTSAQIWTQGRGVIFSRNRIIEFKNNKNLNPPYMEIELLSPLREIRPGRSIHFSYRMICSTVPPIIESISSVKEHGIIVQPLSLETRKNDFFIEGKYGVFIEGKLKIILTQNSKIEKVKTEILYEKNVSPLEGIHVKLNIKKKRLFNENFNLLVTVFDVNEHYLGEIEKK